MTNYGQHVSFIWSIAETLRGSYKQSDYGKVVLPFTVLRRLDYVLDPTRAAVLAKRDTLPPQADDKMRELMLNMASGQNFHNTSRYRFGTDWTAEDQLLFEQICGDMVQNDKLVEQARVNSKEQFRQVFTAQVMTAFIQRLGRNEKIVNEFMANEEVRELVINALLDDVYGRVQERP